MEGWYPDPGGAPGQFRYWDGSVWSAVTTGNPGAPPPAPGAVPARRRGWLIPVAALVVLLAVGLVVGLLRGSPTSVADPVPSASTSAGEDSSPLPFPSTGPSEPVPTPAPSSPDPGPTRDYCPPGEPDFRQDHPADNRIHGGGLSFPRQKGWSAETDHTLTWAYDVGAQQAPGGSAAYAVGALSVVDGFERPEQAAATVVECTANPTFFAGYQTRQTLGAEAITVDGQDGWRMRVDIEGQDPRLGEDGAYGWILEVVVVDLGSPESLAMFWGITQNIDADGSIALEKVITQLRQD
jgi:hypothetical protein